MNRHDRLIGLLLALQSGRKTAAQLAERFDVSRRTILRDIEALSQVGVPVVALTGSGGGYEIASAFWLAPMQFTADEASLLLLGLKSLGNADHSPFGLARSTAEEKLRVILPSKVLAIAQREIDAIDMPAPHRPERLAHLAELRQAVIEGRWLRVGYRSVRRVARHDLRPIRLYVERERWYCAAYALAAGETRSFRVDRILTVEPIDPPFELKLPLEREPSPELIDVVVRLSSAAVRWVDDHPDFAGNVVEDVDGGWLCFATPASELDYFARELLALGPEATTIEPDALRSRIRVLAGATLANHAEDNSDGTLSPWRA